jgi:hypothetical protein
MNAHAALPRSSAGALESPSIATLWAGRAALKAKYDALPDGELASPEADAKTAAHDALCSLDEAIWASEVGSLDDLVIKAELALTSTWLRGEDDQRFRVQIANDVRMCARLARWSPDLPAKVPIGAGYGGGGRAAFEHFEALVAEYHRRAAAVNGGATDEDLTGAERAYRAAQVALMTTPAPAVEYAMVKLEILEQELAHDSMWGKTAARWPFLWLGCVKAEMLALIAEAKLAP